MAMNKYLRKNIYITEEDLALLHALRGYKLSHSELYRKGLSLIPPKELTQEETLAELGVERFAVCPIHHGNYDTCWKNH